MQNHRDVILIYFSLHQITLTCIRSCINKAISVYISSWSTWQFVDSIFFNHKEVNEQQSNFWGDYLNYIFIGLIWLHISETKLNPKSQNNLVYDDNLILVFFKKNFIRLSSNFEFSVKQRLRNNGFSTIIVIVKWHQMSKRKSNWHS